MKRTIVALLVLVAVPVFAQTKPPVVKPPVVSKALAPLQGTWVLTTPGGQSLADGAELTIAVTGDQYAQTVKGEVNERGTIKLDVTKTPWWIDLVITEGNDAGKTQIGLLELKGDTMTGLLKFPGDAVRPTTLTPEPNTIAFVGKKKATLIGLTAHRFIEYLAIGSSIIGTSDHRASRQR